MIYGPIVNGWLRRSFQAIANVKMECDTAAAINGAKLTKAERETIQAKCEDLMKCIDRAAKNHQ